MYTIIAEMPISTDQAERVEKDPHADAALEAELWKRAAVQLRSLVPSDRWWAIRKTFSLTPTGVPGWVTATLRIDIEPGVALKTEPGKAEQIAGAVADVLPGPAGLLARLGAGAVGKLLRRRKK